MEKADDENHLRVVLLFEEGVLKIAMSGDLLLKWPTTFVANDSEATAACIKLSHVLEAYVAACEKPNQPWTALRHSRIVLVAWTIACLQDALLREHAGDAFRQVLKDFAPPLGAHIFEHLLLPEERWMRLGHRVESYLISKADLKHQLLLPGKDGTGDFLALAAAATSLLPDVRKAWDRAQDNAVKAEKDWLIRSDQKEAWATSVALAVDHDKQLLHVGDSALPQPSKRRKLSQTLKRRLAQEQNHSKNQRQSETHSLQRPLPAKVEPLPKMSEYEAEARAIVFSVHLPEELSMLGSSFCLARHLLDFDAGVPCGVMSRPPFSWHCHFYEFAIGVPNLQAAGRFELFSDVEASYRSGKQQESYFHPLKESIGFYHPDNELEGLHFLWRWQGVLLNPFKSSWPQPAHPPELYRMEFEGDEKEEWILGLPSENQILAQLPLHFKDMSKAQFRSLGFIASRPELHLRRLLPALQHGELPLEDPRVTALSQQVLYRFGPRDAPKCFLGRPCFLDRSCKQDLLELANWASAAALPEQFRAFEAEGGPGSIEALTSLMICCSYVAQFGEEDHPARKAMQTCRRVLQSWAQETHQRFRTQDQQSAGAVEVRRRLANILKCYIQSFRLVPVDDLSEEEAWGLAKARINLEHCLGICAGLVNETDMDTVKEICFLHERQLSCRKILDQVLLEFLPAQLPQVSSEWHPPDGLPLEMWRLRETTDGVVGIHPSRGILLFNGKPVGYLPLEIRRHPQFKATFGSVTCFAWPLAKQGGAIYEAGPLNDKTCILGLLPGGELLVQEKAMHSVFTLLPRRFLAQVGLRKTLVENYTHWFAPHENAIDFKPEPGVDDGREYSFQKCSKTAGCDLGRLICTLKHVNDAKMQVFLPSEPGLAPLVRAFGFVEPSEFVEYLGCLGDPCQGRLAEVHFLRLGLKFKLCDMGSGRTLKSADFPGHQLAPKQKLDMLCGFRCFLLLEEVCPFASGAPETWPKPPGLVVLPEGNIKLTQGKHEEFLRCDLQFEGSRRKFSHFKIHWEDGLLEIPTTMGRLHVASLLWACGRVEQETLLGCPARWKSLELLRQCYQNQPHDEAWACNGCLFMKCM